MSLSVLLISLFSFPLLAGQVLKPLTSSTVNGRKVASDDWPRKLSVESIAIEDPHQRSSQLEETAKASLDRGDVAKACHCYEQIVAIDVELYGNDSPITAAAYHSLGHALYKSKAYEGATEAFKMALSIRERSWQADQPEIACCFEWLAMCAIQKENYRDAEFNLARFDAMKRRLEGDQYSEAADTLFWMATCRQRQADAAGAISLFEKALAEYRRNDKLDQSSVRRCLVELEHAYAERSRRIRADLVALSTPDQSRSLPDSELPVISRPLSFREAKTVETVDDHAQVRSFTIGAEMYTKNGDLANAKLCFEQIANIYRDLYGNDSPITATALVRLGIALRKLKELDAANEVLTDALSIYDRAYAGDAIDILVVLEKLVNVNLDRKDHPAVIQFAERRAAMSRRLLGDKDPDTVAAIFEYALTQQLGSDRAALIAAYENALEAFRAAGMESDDRIERCLEKLSDEYQKQENYQRARILQQSLSAARSQRLGPNHRDTLETRSVLAWLCMRESNYDAARTIFEDVLARLQPDEDSHASLAENVTQGLAYTLLLQRRYSDAIPYFAAYLQSNELADNRHKKHAAAANYCLGFCQYSTSEYLSAVLCFEEALAIYESMDHRDELKIAGVHLLLGRCYQEIDPAQCLDHLNQGLFIHQTLLGANHPDTATAHVFLGDHFNRANVVELAQRHYEDALSIERLCKTDLLTIADVLTKLGSLHLRNGELKQARLYLEESLAIRRSKLGDNDANTREVAGLLKELAAKSPPAASPAIQGN